MVGENFKLVSHNNINFSPPLKNNPETVEIGVLSFSRINHFVGGKIGEGLKTAGEKEEKVKSY